MLSHELAKEIAFAGADLSHLSAHGEIGDQLADERVRLGGPRRRAVLIIDLHHRFRSEGLSIEFLAGRSNAAAFEDEPTTLADHRLQSRVLQDKEIRCDHRPRIVEAD